MAFYCYLCLWKVYTNKLTGSPPTTNKSAPEHRSREAHRGGGGKKYPYQWCLDAMVLCILIKFSPHSPSSRVNDSSETWKKLVWSVRGCKSLREDLIDLCERDLNVAHILVSANARFDEANSYAALQSSDALMVEVGGVWQKAKQWSFSQWGSEYDFAELCKGKCWVHVVGRLVRTST